jgi:hypothetical protein
MAAVMEWILWASMAVSIAATAGSVVLFWLSWRRLRLVFALDRLLQNIVGQSFTHQHRGTLQAWAGTMGTIHVDVVRKAPWE